MGLSFTNEEFGALLAELVKAAGIEGNVHLNIPQRGSDRGCAICGSMAYRPVALIGGYGTVLCPSHQNRWHKYIGGHEKFLQLDVLKVDYEIAILNSERAYALTFSQQDREVRNELYNIGERWVKDKRAAYGTYLYDREDSRD